jgi:sulfatase modifying factor 1
MRRILALLFFPVLCIFVLAIDGLGRTDMRADSMVVVPEQPWRPNPVPEINGMVFVPAGEFLMGSTTQDLRHQAEVDEWPQRRVWVDDFYMDIHEVTNAQYKVFLDSTKIQAPPRWVNGNYGIGEDGLPVVSVTWNEAAAYARFMGKRLPTEAEWEKAARGVDGRRFPWGNEWDPTRANNGERLMPIMSFPEGVSPYGCYDMAGNAAEWVDGVHEAYPRDDMVLPQGIPDRKEEFRSDKRIYRGGSWNTFAKYLRCANREATGDGKRWVYVGFRCAKDPPWRETDAGPGTE